MYVINMLDHWHSWYYRHV